MTRQTTLPDFHFLLIADNLGGEWFFDPARQYWNRFRPIVISDYEFLRLIPAGEFSIVVTVIAGRDRVQQLGVDLARIHPDAQYDPILADDFAATREMLNLRAQLNQPFGQPLAVTLEPTVPANTTPVQPTPGSIFTQEAGSNTSGFVTQTPTAAQVPDEQPSEDHTPGPVFPTPGPVTGGG
ncbi:MAG: hypothetical protein D6737_16830 [Chloroflexi bacterium]|nr:MAG: hypothetical protein CUN54_04430 [Phototrophicales bacterium]RMF77725.1 MAG: hypothetical protein D6737_16830 [Chloroflexota bacterium]